MDAVVELPEPLNAKHYTPIAHQEIRAFMQRHRELIPLLKEADRALLSIFPRNTSIKLAVGHDPEIPDTEYLVYGIETSQELPVARACLKAFDETWLLDNVEHLHDKIVFRLRFI